MLIIPFASPQLRTTAVNPSFSISRNREDPTKLKVSKMMPGIVEHSNRPEGRTSTMEVIYN